MRIFVTGGTGFIGSRVVTALAQAGHVPVVLCRSPSAPLPPGAERVVGDPGAPGPWTEAVASTAAAVNLCGEPIHGRWNPDLKRAILRSRVESTRLLVEAIPRGGTIPYTLVSQSGIGYYGFRGDEPLDEDAPPGSDFLADVAVRWEAEARRAAVRGCRVVTLRSGLVLGPGGPLERMVHAFREHGGGPLGDGRQYVSWIHLEDEVRLVLFTLGNPGLSGPVNAVAPHPVTNAEFSRALGEALGRPSGLRVPAFSVRLALGDFAEVLLRGQRVVPRRALSAGFTFRFTELWPALVDLLAFLPDGGAPPRSAP